MKKVSYNSKISQKQIIFSSKLASKSLCLKIQPNIRVQYALIPLEKFIFLHAYIN